MGTLSIRLEENGIMDVVSCRPPPSAEGILNVFGIVRRVLP